MISYCRFITVFLFLFISNFYAASQCLNGGDDVATFKYSGILSDVNGATTSGFQTVEMRLELFSSFESGVEDYSQTITAVEVTDGVFQVEIGPCLPDLSISKFVQLHINNEVLSPRTKLLTSPLSVQSLNSKRFAGLTTTELLLQVDANVSTALLNFTNDNIAPALGTLQTNIESHKAQVNNPHSVTKDQLGLSNVDNIKQLPFSTMQVTLSPTSDSQVPTSKAVADHVALQVNTVNTNLESRFIGLESGSQFFQTHVTNTTNPHQVNKSQVGLAQVSDVLQLPMSYFQTVLVTDSNVNVPSSSAVVAYVNHRFLNQNPTFASEFTSSEVQLLRSGVLSNGASPWLSNVFPSGLGTEYVRGDKSLAEIPADQLSQIQVTNLLSSKLSDGSDPWTSNVFPTGSSIEYVKGDKSLAEIPADQLSQIQVTNLLNSKLSNGSSPWESNIFPFGSGTQYLRGDKSYNEIFADKFSFDEVVNLQNNALADNSKPWTTSEPSLGTATSGQFLNGIKSWVNIDKNLLGLSKVQDINVFDTFDQNLGAEFGTSKVRAISPNGLKLVSQSDQGMIISSQGFIGINNLNPQVALDVIGDLNVAGQLRINGQLLGSVVKPGDTTGTALVGGNNNIAASQNSIVVGGFDNHALADNSLILGGMHNTVHTTNSVIIGGSDLEVYGQNVLAFNASGQSLTISTATTDAAIFIVRKFGIGTLNPTEDLDVAGRLRLRTSTDTPAHDGTLRWTGSDLELMKLGSWGPIVDTSINIQDDATGVRIRQGGSTRFVVDSIGYVGINTDSPADNFHVVGNTLLDGDLLAREIHLSNGDFTDFGMTSNLESIIKLDIKTAVAGVSGIEFSQNGAAKGLIEYAHPTAFEGAEILFEVDNAPRMRIKTDVLELFAGMAIKFADGSMQSTGTYPDKIENGLANNKIFIDDFGINFNLLSSTQIRINTHGNLGLGEFDPQERLVVDGRIQMKVSTEALATDGSIRYSGFDIEAFVRGNWKSMTGQESSQGVTEDTISPSPNLPIALEGADAVLVNDDIFVLGGQNSSGVSNQLFKFNIASDSWSTMSAMPSARVSMSSVYINNHIYVIGGNDGSSDLSSVMKYDPVTDGWTTLSASWDFGSTIINASAVSHEGKIFMLGGNNGTNVTNLVFSLDPTISPSWNEGLGMSEEKEKAVALSFDGKIYIFGGIGISMESDLAFYLDPQGWNILPTMPNPLMDMAAFVLDGDIYLVGGDVSGVTTNAIVKFEPDSETYLNSTEPLFGNSKHLFAVSNFNKAYISGGLENDTISNTFYEFEIPPFVAASGANAFVGEGFNNSAESSNSGVLAGDSNTVKGDNSVVVAGNNNIVDSLSGFIGSGGNNKVTGDFSSSVGGASNTVTGAYSAILGGINNTVLGSNSSILGGQGLQIGGNNVIAFNGYGSTVEITTSVNNAAIFIVDKFSIGEVNPDDTFEINDIDSDAILHLKGAGNSTLKLDAAGTVSNSQILFLNTDVMKGMFDFNHDASLAGEELSLYIGGTTKFTFTGEGRLGIGITNPTFTLDVLGDIKSSSTIAIVTAVGDTLIELDSGSSGDNNIISFGHGGVGYGKIRYSHHVTPDLGEVLFDINSTIALSIKSDVITLPVGSGIEFGDGSIIRSAKKSAFSVYNIGIQSVATDTYVTGVYTHSSYDLNTEFDFVSGEFTVLTSGIYNFNARVAITGSVVDGKNFQVIITKDGVEVLENRCVTNGTSAQSCSVSGSIELSTGDKVAVEYHHNTGGSLDMDSNKKHTHFDGHLIYQTDGVGGAL